ncbi:hypothetical protein [Halorarius litoreus]|uniref:hypothetical protein n=1 Tax=Halorarius litoreus TaxID=2962676 RepID=UPI0020CD0269|nr:hypothetical protein [Halorarius litoreus]
MGVYKRLSEVPSHRRLERYASEYEDADTYERFLVEERFDEVESERCRQKYRLAGRRWKEHIESRGRHHALARPADVEAWLDGLLDRVSLNTAYNVYWVKLEQFYSWLQHHPDHPHTYHPLWMAAAESEHAGIVWERKIDRGRAYHE